MLKTTDLIIFLAVIALMVVLFFALNNPSKPTVSQTTTAHNITGLDGLLGSIQPGVFGGLGGAVQGGIGGLFTGNSGANASTTSAGAGNT